MNWKIASDVRCTADVEDNPKCSFCGSPLDVKGAVKNKSRVKSHIHKIKELAGWRRRVNALYEKVLEGKIALDHYLRERAKLYYNFSWIGGYSSSAVVKCKKCGRSRAFGVHLNIGVEVPEQPDVKQIAALSVPDEVALKLASRCDMKLEEFEAFKERNPLRFVKIVEEGLKSGLI